MKLLITRWAIKPKFEGSDRGVTNPSHLREISAFDGVASPSHK